MQYLMLIYENEGLIEARDLDAAVEIAARIPAARYGSIEVRPIMNFD